MKTRFKILIFSLLSILLISACKPTSSISSSSSQTSTLNGISSTSNDSTNSTTSSDELSLEEILYEVEVLIANELKTKVMDDLNLITTVEKFPAISIDWESSHPNIISSNGKYTAPENDIYVELTYTINHYWTVLATHEVSVYVLGVNSSTYEKVVEWLYSYNFDIPNPLIFPCTIRTSVVGHSNLKIEWSSSSNTLQIEDNYLMPRSTALAQTVTLTAKIDCNDAIASRNFKITIPKRSEVLPAYGSKYHGLPIIDIKTDNGSLPVSKTNYITGTFKMSESQAYINSEPVVEVPMQIRIRGNWTAEPDKKPYRIKFDKKQGLLGMEACKNWVLLAEQLDESYLREAANKTLARSLDGMAFNTRSYHVEVYVNGDYRGLYLLTDQVQEHESRVNIYEGGEAVDTGYLFEWDFKVDDKIKGKEYFELLDRTMQMVYPEQLTAAQASYLVGHVTQVYNAIKDNPTNISAYSTIFNINSAIDYIIVNEVFKNQDVWHLSSYMIKDKDKPLEFGPVWDFHLSSGSCYYEDRAIPNEWHTMLKNKNLWFYYLMLNEQFRILFKQRWNEVVNNQIKDMMEFINKRKLLIDEAAYHSNAKWGVVRTNLPPLAGSLKTYDQFVKFFYDWLNASISFMDTEINKPEFITTAYRSRFSIDYTAAIVNQKETALSNLPKYFD